MQRTIFSISALLCVLIFTPLASAQQGIHDNNDFVIENICNPQEFAEQWVDSGLDFDQLEMVRIQLLERGFDPGFDLNRDNTLDTQLMEALAQFQAESDLPVTGQTDIPTLVALSFPIQQIEWNYSRGAHTNSGMSRN
jgi:hypothetical protein